MKEIKVIIAGNRKYYDEDFIFEKMDYLLKNIKNKNDIVIVSGTASGADKIGEKYAFERNYKVLRFFPDWDQYGKAAGMTRNEEMAKVADFCVIFFRDNISKGSEGMRKLCEKYNIPYRSYINRKIYKYKK